MPNKSRLNQFQNMLMQVSGIQGQKKIFLKPKKIYLKISKDIFKNKIKHIKKKADLLKHALVNVKKRKDYLKKD